MSAQSDTEKNCPRCGYLKQFGRNKYRYNGLQIWCKDCLNEYGRQWRNRPEVRERLNAQALARYHALPDEVKARYNSNDKKASQRLKKKYGITLEDYEQRLAEQGGVCEICGSAPSQNRLSVDHDHDCCPATTTCGKCLRGLLCAPCNRGLGYLESPGWIQAAHAYLEKHAAADKIAKRKATP